ncbi:MAG: RNA-binding protein [Deltaproteobacteria bacterium]|nr:RNA-binding protein [Deltaproteobacteria bacterium]
MKGSKLYVGNISHSVTNEELKELFSSHGTVQSVNIIQGKGFGFVEMSNQSEAENAKKALDGYAMKGRSLRVNPAQPPKSRSGGRGGYRSY